MTDRDIHTPIELGSPAGEAGYSSLRQDLAEYLGPVLLAEATIDAKQEEIKRAIANTQFLIQFGQLLPQPTTVHHPENGATKAYNNYHFSISPGDTEAKVRHIQEHTIWLVDKWADMPEDHVRPYFIVGRKQLGEDSNVESLLLLSVTGNNPKFRSVAVRKDDMQKRDELVAQLKDTRIPEQEVNRSIDRQTGEYIVRSTAKGNIGLVEESTLKKYQLKQSSSEFLTTSSKVRTSKQGSAANRIIQGVSGTALREHHVDEILSQLAADFNLEDKLRELIGRNTEVKDERVSHQQVLNRHQRLEATFKSMLAKSGHDEASINQLLASIYGDE